MKVTTPQLHGKRAAPPGQGRAMATRKGKPAKMGKIFSEAAINTSESTARVASELPAEGNRVPLSATAGPQRPSDQAQGKTKRIRLKGGKRANR
jgi:hypothetical protein